MKLGHAFKTFGIVAFTITAFGSAGLFLINQCKEGDHEFSSLPLLPRNAMETIKIAGNATQTIKIADEVCDGWPGYRAYNLKGVSGSERAGMNVRIECPAKAGPR